MDEKKLEKLAKLARIEVKEEAKARLLELLNDDINTVKAVYDINTDGLEPLTNPYDMVLETHKDIVTDGNKGDIIMSCAPESMYNYFIVPKVLDN